MSTIKVDNLQTTGGAGLYPAKAWVNFNGTGTVAIRDDENVSSITDISTGRYTTNITNAMVNANYEASGSAGNTSTTTSNELIVYGSNVTPTAPTTTAIGNKIITSNATVIVDTTYVTLSAHGQLA